MSKEFFDSECSSKYFSDSSSYEYQIDKKRVFIVVPVYREDSSKSIHDVLLNLMIKHES